MDTNCKWSVPQGCIQSVMIIIYANVLSQAVNSFIEMFAKDTKICSSLSDSAGPSRKTL